ncbi:unnamed protein product [Albugo candida]|uniref:Phosphoribosyltransferase domain-containing protein n=1 Tax=Albugo candida TaxID=65357 RepID=A0A024G7P9_9STRA|nr:unnamed protein product [Albugo candida]|eukprot:CCI42778.1 unnamed protein product [Albugo candida]
MGNTGDDGRAHQTLRTVSSAQPRLRQGDISLQMLQPDGQKWLQSHGLGIEPGNLHYQAPFAGVANTVAVQAYDSTSAMIPTTKKQEHSRCQAHDSFRRRRSRYLTKLERSDIIARIKVGEKQSYLANEYAVSRAAICNLYKKHKSQEEITDRVESSESRVQSPIRTPLESVQIGSFQHRSSRLFQMDSHSVPIQNILNMLNDPRVSSVKFRHLVDRLVRLLIEEAVAYKSRLFCTSNSRAQSEWEDQNICGLMMRRKLGEDVMLRTFSQLYPWSKVGCVSLSFWDERDGNYVAPNCIVQFDLEIIKGVQYFLLDHDCDTGEEVCAVVQHLVTQFHIQESDICYIALFSSAAGAQRLAWQFPRITVFCTNLYQDQFSDFSSVYRDVFHARYWLHLAPRNKHPQESIVIQIEYSRVFPSFEIGSMDPLHSF